MNERRIIKDHDFYCTCCGKKGIPISRDKKEIRERGHLKILFCIYCNKEINHVEVVENWDYDSTKFEDEYNSGNFDSDGQRILPLKKWESMYYGIPEWRDEKSICEEDDDIEEWYRRFNN